MGKNFIGSTRTIVLKQVLQTVSRKILIIYDSRDGMTKKVADVVAEGAKRVSKVTVEAKIANSVSTQDVTAADGYAFGSPSHFGFMSGKILTLLTDLYSIRDKMAGKPVTVFTTGAGDQAKALENLERVLGAFDPEFVKPGIAIETVPGRARSWEVDRVAAAALGERLAKAVAKEKPYDTKDLF
ncbi:MAG: NAD(P)H-dependent oxidoreductase [Candidatus Bathyarchaeia archaeon]